MKRWIQFGIVYLVAIAAGAAGLKGTRPNIIFFLGDDQSRFDHSAYGNTSVPTPTTDAFAREGMVFEKAFTGQAVCAPSRSMLYSGLYPVRAGCFVNHTSIRPGVKTLPAYLSALGYEVILAGKSHVNPDDQFEWTHHFKPVEKAGLPRPWIPVAEMDAYFAGADGPFCMMVASEYPHGPYFRESPFAPDAVQLPPFASDSEGYRQYTARYYASIAEKEREFNALLKLLEKHGLNENTVVFYSDDHGQDRGKFTVYDSGLNVAFMVRWPQHIKPGRTDALISFADFVPTAIELAGGTVPSDLDGKSLLPVLQGVSRTHHAYVYGVTHNQGIQQRHVFPQRSVHDGRYHYIHNFNTVERIERERAAGKPIDYFLERGAKKQAGLPEEQLFDTQSDPHEMTDLADRPELAEVKERLRRELFRWMEQQHDGLTENGPVPFLKVKMHELDRPAPQFKYELPPQYIGALKGKKQDPHQLTAP